MKITNEILLSFVHCSYKAFRKCKSEIGEISDYEKIFGQLKHSRKLLYPETLTSENILIKTQSEGTDIIFNNENNSEIWIEEKKFK